MPGVRRIAVIWIGVTSATFCGCDQSNEQQQVQQPPAAQPQAQTSGRLSETPQSSLGGAKRAAENTASKVEQKQRELEKQIDP
jgi:hypothetical protein